jgi:subtilase family serine protease
MKNLARRAAKVPAYLALLGMVACNGGHSSLPAAGVSSSSVTPVNGGAHVATSGVYGANLLSGASYVGPATLNSVGLDVWVQTSNDEGLRAYAKAANDPTSPLYRHWLTPQEIGARFGASQASYTRVAQYLNNYGMAVESFPQRQMLRVFGPQAGVEAALGMTLGVYKKGTQTFIAPTSTPKLPSALKIAGLTSIVTYRFRNRDMVPVRAANGLLQGYAPQQIANVFDYTGAAQAGFTGSGITIGIIGTGPITDNGSTPGDVSAFCFMFGRSCAPVSQVYSTNANVSPGNGSNGGSYSLGLATPPPVTSPNAPGCITQGVNLFASPPTYPTDYTTCNPEDGEAQLDTEQAASLAPGASVQFFIAYNPNECYSPGTYTPPTTCPAPVGGPPTQELGIFLTDDEIQEAIGTNTADIVSMSFGGDEPDSLGFYYDSSGVGFGPTEFGDLAAEGVAIFASSGDNGAQACAGSTVEPNPNQECVSYPATDPSVVSVGGLNTPLNSAGQLEGPLTGWGQQTQTGGSGGGCSETFTQPAFEHSLTPADPCTALVGNKRSQPDVSLDADVLTGVAVVVDALPNLGGRQVFPIGGTSVAAPEAAAMWALVLSACKATSGCGGGFSGHPYRLGNPNNYFYKIYQNEGGTSYGSVFYDVLYGANGAPFVPTGPTPGPTATPEPTFANGYNAGPGLDLVTGLGAPYARNLIKAVVGI